MTERERLIAMISEFTEHLPHEDGQPFEEALADHLLGAGVKIIPAKVGDAAYILMRRGVGGSWYVLKCRINEIVTDLNSDFYAVLDSDDMRYRRTRFTTKAVKDLGVTWFLSAEEAKQAAYRRTGG